MIRRVFPWWVWGVIAGTFMMITIGISIGFTIYWVRSGLSNECAALNYIVANDRFKSGPFYHAIVEWATNDGCR